MSNPLVRPSGALTTNGVVAAGDGVLTYAECFGGDLAVYTSSSTGGDLICSISSGFREFSAGVKYNKAYVTISAGTAVLHGTNVAKTT
jgi:hypothetical protein